MNSFHPNKFPTISPDSGTRFFIRLQNNGQGFSARIFPVKNPGSPALFRRLRGDDLFVGLFFLFFFLLRAFVSHNIAS